MSDEQTVTVDLGEWADQVDTYRAVRGLSRADAVLALVRSALTAPERNHVRGDVHL